MNTVKVNPEFGIELALAVPYAYWLYKNNQLETVITSRDMKPFYYFCNDVREEFDYRTIDNHAAGLDKLPNIWIHGIDPLEKPGILDYSQWVSPPYKEHYKNDEFDFGKPIVFISNIYNFEHGKPPKYHFFDILTLYEMFTYLVESGYAVIYKRPTNEEGFAIDQNEINSVRSNLNILANIEGIGVISDRDLPNYLQDVWLFDDIVKKYPQYTYNEVQLKIMANTDKFISVCGGNGILSSLFGGTSILYVTQGRELRPNYFSDESYWKKLSGADVIPVFDFITDINDKDNNYGHKINDTGKNNYFELLQKMREEF